MSVYFLIPAREGSKRLLFKNIREIMKKPLVLWSIDAVKKSKYFNDNLYVSTESEKIKKVVCNQAKVIDRPRALAEDNIWTQDVINHFINSVEALDDDIIVVIQANSPEVEFEKIDDAIDMLIDNGLWQVHSVDNDLINNGAIHVMRAFVKGHCGKVNYNGFIKTDYVDIHNKEDLKEAGEKMLIKKAVKDLRKYGVASIEGFLDKARCSVIKNDILNFLNNEIKNDSNIIFDKKNSFNKKRINKDVIINFRGINGHDSNMIDFINPDKVIQSFSDLYTDQKITDLIKALSKISNQKFSKLRSHAYINRGVTDTRGYHRDCNIPGKQYKIFVYLTDVLSKDSGPYCYKKNDTEETIFLGQTGTLIISDQHGLHRGFPQKKDSERVMAVINLIKE